MLPDCPSHLFIMLLDCPKDWFRCEVTNQCFPSSMKCDGVVHCTDGSDEDIDRCGKIMCIYIILNDRESVGMFERKREACIYNNLHLHF